MYCVTITQHTALAFIAFIFIQYCCNLTFCYSNCMVLHNENCTLNVEHRHAAHLIMLSWVPLMSSNFAFLSSAVATITITRSCCCFADKFTNICFQFALFTISLPQVLPVCHKYYQFATFTISLPHLLPVCHIYYQFATCITSLPHVLPVCHMHNPFMIYHMYYHFARCITSLPLVLSYCHMY